MDLEPASLRVGGGPGVSPPGGGVQRAFEVLYLDERARVVRFLPGADSGSAPQLFVFERIGEEAAEEEEEEEDEDGPEVGALCSPLPLTCPLLLSPVHKSISYCLLLMLQC